MIKQTEALRLALEALEMYLNIDTMDEIYLLEMDLAPKAVTALRQALAEQTAQTDWEAVAADQAMTIALLKAEQPAQQEPVGSLSVRYHRGCKSMTNIDFDYNGDLPEGDYELYTSPPAQQEPVAYWIPKAEQFCIADPSGRPFAKAWKPLYTSPQPAQRTWIGLSDLDIEELENEYMKSAQTAHQFLRAIEAKLKEKNT